MSKFALVPNPPWGTITLYCILLVFAQEEHSGRTILQPRRLNVTSPHWPLPRCPVPLRQFTGARPGASTPGGPEHLPRLRDGRPLATPQIPLTRYESYSIWSVDGVLIPPEGEPARPPFPPLRLLAQPPPHWGWGNRRDFIILNPLNVFKGLNPFRGENLSATASEGAKISPNQELSMSPDGRELS